MKTHPRLTTLGVVFFLLACFCFASHLPRGATVLSANRQKNGDERGDPRVNFAKGRELLTEAQNTTAQATALASVDFDSTSSNPSASPTVSASQVIISEFRLRGPAGVADEFVEIYNNTDSDITVATNDESAGWAAVAADGQTRFIIPNSTMIPARGHFLGVNTLGYSLSGYPAGPGTNATGDQVLVPPDLATTVGGYSLDIPDGSGIALFRTANPANFTMENRLDAVGYARVDALYREGPGFPAGGGEATINLEYSFLRSMTRATGGIPKDTNANLADFIGVNTTAYAMSIGQMLGAPGPENLSSPTNRTGQFSTHLLDPSADSSAPPNRVREFGQVPNGTFGTLSIRRTFTNNTGAPVTQLRFRIVEITSFIMPAVPGQADLRALNSNDLQVMVGGNPVDVRGTIVETPLSQAAGGGWNASMVPSIGGNLRLNEPLAPVASITVQFLLGVNQTGAYRFFVNLEAATVNTTVNNAPAVSAGADQTITLPAIATLNGSASDDGLPAPPAALTLSWSQISGPTPALVSAPSQAATAASFVQPGTYVLQLTANDGVLSSSATTQVTVLDGPPKLAPLPDRTIPAGTKYSVQLSADDPNTNDTLSYFLDSAPAGASLSLSRAVVWTPTSAQLGINEFTVRVVDAAAHSDNKTFRITVEAANHAPQLAEQADERVPSGGRFTRALGATDPDGDALTYALVSGPAGLALSGNQLSWNPVATTPGDYPVTVKVSDAAGLIDSKRFKVSVFAASVSAVRDDSYEVSVGQTLAVPAPGVLANDADPNGGALTAAKLTNPDKGAVSAFNADGSFTYVAPPTPGGPVLDVTRAPFFRADAVGASPPLVADVDGDGKPDIITNEYHGPFTALHVYRGDTGTEIFFFLAPPPAQVGGMSCSSFGGGQSTFAAADIDDDGRIEIVRGINCGVGGESHTRLVAVAYDASLPERFRVKWLSEPIINSTVSLSAPSDSNFTVARLSPGDKPVVLVGGTTIGQCAQIRAGSTDAACRGVWALNGDDGSLNRVYYSAPADQSSISRGYTHGALVGATGGFMGPVVADVDDDGTVEILYEGTLWNIDGTVRHQFDGTTNSATQSSVVVNLDGDAQMEIVTIDASHLGVGAGLLRAWEASGQLIWQVPLPRTGVVTKLSVADVERDGRPDFVFGITNTIWVIDHAGRIKWLRNISTAADGFSEQFSGGTAYATSFPVYDLNGDGTPEMIVQYGNNTIRFLRADTGEEQTSWTHPGSPVWSGFGLQSPIVADVDGSGHASVVFQRAPQSFCGGCEGHVQVLRGDTVPWQPAPTHYNQHAYWESNFNADGSVPTTYARHTTDPRTNVFGQQPQAPYAPGFRLATETSFTYAATNEVGLSSTATVNIHIAPRNRAPKFTSKPPSAYLGHPAQTIVDYQAHAVDPDPGDTVTYGLAAAITDHAMASVDPNTGLVHLSRLHFGEHTFVITATDSHGVVGVQTITLRQASGTTSVPGVVGMTETDAASSLTAAQLSVGEITRQHTSAPEGTVLGQSPAAGTTLLQGESVDLTVSLGPAPVVVPNVVGSARTAALTTLSGGGFTATVTQVFSNTVPAGTVMAQSPAAGTFVAPTPANPVALTVSAGTGLSLSLTRSVTTADQTITVTPAAFDVNGDPAAVPTLTYTITPKQTPFAGALPTLSGTTITPGLETLGSFTITATDAANSRSASQDFAVLTPRVPGAKTNGESFAHMAEVLEQMHALRQPLKAALAANDTAQMTVLLQQMVTLWRTVDLDDLRISQPLTTADQFAPTVEMMQGFGHSATPDDVIANRVLKDSIEDLTAWTEGLKSSSVTITQLDAMADWFSTRAARMDGLVISRYGGINNSPQYTRLMTHAIPNFYEALTNELALLTGMPVRKRSFPFLAQNAGEDGDSLKPSRGALSTLPRLASVSAKPRPAKGQRLHHTRRAAAAPGTLAELAVTQATQIVVDKIMEEGAKTYKNAKKYAADIMAQAAWTATAVAVVGELRAFLKGKDIDAVVSGASLSFREFQSAPGWIEVSGSDDPAVSVVMVIGPDLFVKTQAGGQDFVQKLKDGYSTNIEPLTNTKRYKNANEVKDGLSKMLDVVKNALADVNELVSQQSKLVFQSPDEVMNGCLFSADPACRQLIYRNGFQPVYTYSPPPGFASLGGLPVPIIFIVYNAADGGMSFGTPSFLPCTYVDAEHKIIQCPNNDPFTP